MRNVCLTLLIGLTVLPTTTFTLVDGTVDEDQVYSNVGALVIQFLEGNPAGAPPGTTMGICTGTLIHKRVFLTAGHCVARGVFGLPPGVRLFVTFSPDDVLDQSQWIQLSPLPGTLVVHPTFPLPCIPGGACPLNDVDGLPEFGVSDIGLIFLDHPVKGIKPAQLGHSELDGQVSGVRMTVVGYGATKGPVTGATFSGIRRYGTSTVDTVIDTQWVTFNRDPVKICAGDSGSPTFYQGRLVAVVSDGHEDCTSADVRSRVESGPVRSWIKATIETRLGE